MKCINCKEDMYCYDDVNDISTRIDFCRCEQCDIKADIIFNCNDITKFHIEWHIPQWVGVDLFWK